MDIEEIIKILIAVLVLALMVGAIIFLFKGKGGEVFESIRNVLRFGR